jgi:hypothetical protein
MKYPNGLRHPRDVKPGAMENDTSDSAGLERGFGVVKRTVPKGRPSALPPIPGRPRMRRRRYLAIPFFDA